jgi:hypothetical protein
MKNLGVEALRSVPGSVAAKYSSDTDQCGIRKGAMSTMARLGLFRDWALKQHRRYVKHGGDLQFLDLRFLAHEWCLLSR